MPGVNVRTVQVRQASKGDGAYAIAAISGVFSGVAAGTATAGHLFAVRWPGAVANSALDPRLYFVLQRFRAKWRTNAGFTAAQQVAMDLIIARSYTAPHTGGVGSMTPSSKRTSFATSLVTAANMQIANAGALTAGTQTLDAQPIKADEYAELAAAATVPKGTMDIFLSQEDLDRYPIVLAQNEGLVLRNLVAMGAGGTAQLIVEMDWLEVTRY